MTLMERAAKGITPEIEAVSTKEGVEAEIVRRRLVAGRIVIASNPIHAPEPCGIGEGLSVKVNVNIGTSRDRVDLEEELKKAQIAVRYGADAIMDLSTGGDIDAIRRAVIKEVRIPVGTVPIYQTGLRMARKSAVVDMDEDDIFQGMS